MPKFGKVSNIPKVPNALVYFSVISSGALRGEAGGAEGAVGRDRAAYIGT